MKNIRAIFFTFCLLCVAFVTAQTRGVANNVIPGDNNMRYYRLALPVTLSAYENDLGSDYDNVLRFWQECEDYANRMFVPLGICFDVVEDSRLVMTASNLIDENIYNTTSFGTELTDAAIGSANYDVGMWVHYRADNEENSGLSVANGAYASSTKSNGYAKTDKWVVAHELGHMFGASSHTTQGEGSLMDNEGEFFSYPSIKLIRNSSVSKGVGSAYLSKSVSNNAPQFTNGMKDTYCIPKGACMAIPVLVTDAENHLLTYSAIGCSSANIGYVTETDGYELHFKSLPPQTSNIIDYSPKYKEDIFYEGDFYALDGTDIPSMEAGSYSIAFLVNDMPSSTAYDYLLNNPFYSNYAVWDANVEIVAGTVFTASISSKKNTYSAGEEVTVTWGVNHNYFTADSRVRITMSTNYGETFDYVLAESVPATDGSCVVTLPNVNVGNVDVNFVTTVRSMRGGIIRVEEIGGIAYTLTTLTPENGGGFTITGGEDVPVTKEYTISVEANPAAAGSAIVNGGTTATVNDGSAVTLIATVNNGYTFDGWYNGASKVSSELQYTFTPSASGTYIAEFNTVETEEPEQPSTVVDLGGKYYRIKVKGDSNYMTVANTNYVAGITSVTVAANNDSDTQIFFLEKSDNGYKIQQRKGNYLNCDRWSVHANANHEAAVVFTFEPTSEEFEYLIKWDNTNTYNDGTECNDYFKVENSGVFCDAPIGKAATWKLEEVIPIDKATVSFSGATYTNYAGNEISSGWGYQLVTNTTPNVTIKVDGSDNKLGWTTKIISGVKTPYLAISYNFILSVPKPYKIAGYRMTVRGESDNYSGDFTCTVGGEETSRETLSGTTEKTVTATGLNTSTVNIGVGGNAGTGIFITALEITYVEVEDVNVTLSSNPASVGVFTINGEAVSTKGVEKGSEVTVVATATGNYGFLNWTNNGVVVSTDATYTFTVEAATNLVANFVPEEILQDGAVYQILNAHYTSPQKGIYDDGIDNAQTADFGTDITKSVWRVVKKATNCYSLRNAKTNRYLKGTTAQSGKWTMSEAETSVYVYKISDGRYYISAVELSDITRKSMSCAHNPGDHNNLVTWNNVDDNGAVTSASVWNFNPIEEITYTVMDNAGNEFTGTKLVAPGAERKPVFTGVNGYELKNEAWDGSNYTATITFPLSVSKEGETPNEILITIYENDRYLHAIGDDVKVQKTDVAPVDINCLWSVYPKLENESFKFAIKNISSGKYIYSEAQNNTTITQTKGTVVLKDTPSWFEYVVGNEFKGLKFADKANLYLSINGANDTDALLGVHNAIHKGTDIFTSSLNSYGVIISDAGYATFYADKAVNIPDKVDVFYLTKDGITENSILMTKLEKDVIPAKTGVVLRADPGVYNFEFNITEQTETVSSVLQGTVMAECVSEDAYVLSELDGAVGLYLAEKNKNDGTAFLNNGHKAYLPKRYVPAAAQLSVGFEFRFSATTAIEELESISTEVIYDLQGRRVNEIILPGIYIVNGKKKIIQ